MNTIDKIVLCQDCLAVSLYSDAKHNEDEFCACGGQWCGCEDCQETAMRLRNGERRAGVLRSQRDITEFWCEETGIRQVPA